MATFYDRMRVYLGSADEALRLELLSGGFAFDCEMNGEMVGVRRMRDVMQEEETGRIVTDFFCFPQNGKRDKLKEGVCFSFSSTVKYPDRTAENENSARAVFLDPGPCAIWKASMEEVYYSHVSSRAGGLIEGAGELTFLHHTPLVITPKKETVPLDEFDFAANKLFMLGLYGGEYQIGIRER